MFRRKPRRSRKFKQENNVTDIDEARRKRREKRALEQAELRRKEEEKLQNDRKKEINAKKRARYNRRRMTYIAIIIVIVLVIALSAVNIVSLHLERRSLIKKQQELVNTRDKLEHELEHVNTPEYIEQQARDNLRLIKPGEILYIQSDEKTEEKE